MIKVTKRNIGHDGYWTLDARPGDIEVNGRAIPYAFSLGTIKPDGTINVWTPAAHVPKGYKEVARTLLEDARDELMRNGELIRG
jgi:hypothetical protein